MSKKPIALLALACAGACAIPLVLPLLAGAGLIAAGTAWLKPSFEIIACGGLAILAAWLLLLSWRRSRAGPVEAEGATCPTDGSCGCRSKP